MDEIAKHASSYQCDQEILDARGIGMTVAEVAGLSTVRYSEKVQSLHLNSDDLAFLKGLRRRIKNRLASQNSRRRSMENLRRLTRELRVVRACKGDALSDRRTLLEQRERVRDSCERLTLYIEKILKDRNDTTALPKFVPPPPKRRKPETKAHESQEKQKEVPIKKVTVAETKIPILAECFAKPTRECKAAKTKEVFECRIDRLVQQSVNHIFKTETDEPKSHTTEKPRIVCAKTVFISNCAATGVSGESNGYKDVFSDEEVLNLSVKSCGRRHHGRKQSAPRKIEHPCGYEDAVLDLKIKKENQ